MNKTRQNLTIQPKVNPLTGLTATQEKCALMLAAGERVSAVAEKVRVSRTTIYQWGETVTFQCYLNQLRDEVLRYTNQTLLTLADDALTALRQSLASDNDALRLRASTWVLERIAKTDVGECNPYSVVRKQATHPAFDWSMDKPEFNRQDYERKLKALGLQESALVADGEATSDTTGCID